jgi:hypothetical protein
MAVALTGTPSTHDTLANAAAGAGTYSSFSYTPESGSDRLCVLCVGMGEDNGNGVISAVTLGGQSMTQVGTVVTDSSWVSVEVWVLNEAGIAAMSGSTVVVTRTGNIHQLGMIACTLTGVDQATSTTSPQSGFGTGQANIAASASVTSTSGGMVVGACMTDDQTGITPDFTQIAETAVMETDTILNAQYTAGTGGSINLTWDNAASQGYAIRTFNVQASAGGGSSSISASPSATASSSISASPSSTPSSSASPSVAGILLIERPVFDYYD